MVAFWVIQAILVGSTEQAEYYLPCDNPNGVNDTHFLFFLIKGHQFGFGNGNHIRHHGFDVLEAEKGLKEFPAALPLGVVSMDDVLPADWQLNTFGTIRVALELTLFGLSEVFDLFRLVEDQSGRSTPVEEVGFGIRVIHYQFFKGQHEFVAFHSSSHQLHQVEWMPISAIHSLFFIVPLIP